MLEKISLLMRSLGPFNMISCPTRYFYFISSIFKSIINFIKPNNFLVYGKVSGDRTFIYVNPIVFIFPLMLPNLTLLFILVFLSAKLELLLFYFFWLMKLEFVKTSSCM